MKFLVALSLLQTACIIAIIVQLANNDDDALPVVAERTALVNTASTDAAQRNTDAGAHLYPDETRLRRIIREELAALLGDGTNSGRQAQELAVAEVRNPTEDRYQREFVDQQIEYYRSIGAISHSQMQDLQREIARLDQDDRRAMLGKLVRAMNAGEIEGQF